MTQVPQHEFDRVMFVAVIHHEPLELVSGMVNRLQVIYRGQGSLHDGQRHFEDLMWDDFVVYCGYHNHAYIFHTNARGVLPYMVAVQRLQGRSAYLGEFQYKIAHISVKDNL